MTGTRISIDSLPRDAWVPKNAVDVLYRAVGTRVPSSKYLWAQLEDRELWLLYAYADEAHGHMHFRQWVPVLRGAGRELLRRQGETALEDASVRAVRSLQSGFELINEALGKFSGGSPGFNLDAEFPS